MYDLYDSREDVADENCSYCHRDPSSSPFPRWLPPVTDHFHERQNAHSGWDPSIAREDGGWWRKRRRDPWYSAVVEGTVDPGGLDVPAPPRVKVGDFAFYPFAFASDKRAVIADERAVFRGNDIWCAKLTARLTVRIYWSCDPPPRHRVEWGPVGRSRDELKTPAKDLRCVQLQREQHRRWPKAKRDMSKNRRGGAASRGQVLLLRLLLACALIVISRQEGKFVRLILYISLEGV